MWLRNLAVGVAVVVGNPFLGFGPAAGSLAVELGKRQTIGRPDNRLVVVQFGPIGAALQTDGAGRLQPARGRCTGPTMWPSNFIRTIFRHRAEFDTAIPADVITPRAKWSNGSKATRMPTSMWAG